MDEKIAGLIFKIALALLSGAFVVFLYRINGCKAEFTGRRILDGIIWFVGTSVFMFLILLRARLF